MKYLICGYTRPQLVQAGTVQKNVTAAIKVFHERNPNSSIETINGKHVIGFDEGSGKPIYEGDKYQTCEDGPMILVKRAKRRR